MTSNLSTGLLTRDGHPINVHYWDGSAKSAYVEPLPSDMAVGDDERCSWEPGMGDDYFREKGGCGLKPDHTCGHATGVRIEYQSLYSEEKGS